MLPSCILLFLRKLLLHVVVISYVLLVEMKVRQKTDEVTGFYLLNGFPY